jgi:nucleoside-diphosphate-sugar epimerase
MGSILDTPNANYWIKKIGPDVIVHLAWASTTSKNYRDNLENYSWFIATSNLADYCIKNNIWFITLGSALDAEPKNLFERSPYEISKTLLRNELDTKYSSGLITLVRPEYIFSISERRPRVVRDFLSAQPNVFEVVREPDKYIKFIHIDDVAMAIAVILEGELKGFVDVGGAALILISDFLNVACLSVGLPLSYTWRDNCVTVQKSNQYLSKLNWHNTSTKAFLITGPFTLIDENDI